MLTNKTELIVVVTEKVEISKKNIEKTVKAFIEIVSDKLVKGGKTQLIGSGMFEISKRPAREGRNPKTGEAVTIAASKTPEFEAGKALKDVVNK